MQTPGFCSSEDITTYARAILVVQHDVYGCLQHIWGTWYVTIGVVECIHIIKVSRIHMYFISQLRWLTTRDRSWAHHDISHFNPLALENWIRFLHINPLQANAKDYWLWHLSWKYPLWHWAPMCLISMGPGNGLVPSSTKPFPESMYWHSSLMPYGVTGPMGIRIPLFYIFIYASTLCK